MKHKFGIGTISSIAPALSANVASGQTASEDPDAGTGKGLVSIWLSVNAYEDSTSGVGNTSWGLESRLRHQPLTCPIMLAAASKPT